MKYFKNSISFTICSFIFAVFMGGIKFGLIVLILGLLEVALSFDNAIVNATVLKDMDTKWRKRFLTWGMLIAVVGMRFVFPILIVMFAGKLGVAEAIKTALYNPTKYETILNTAHSSIMAFGGAFLMLVSFNYFFDVEKDIHWINWLEKHLIKLGAIKSIEIGIALIIICIAANYTDKGLTVLLSGITGIVTYIAVECLGSILESTTTANIAKVGIGGFLYLEVLDASFSFDGVISSFIITNNIWLIALGLGIGACFIRSLTLLFVDKGVLQEYRYLEAGAFYSITVLWILSFVSIYKKVPDIITGLISVVIIALAFVSSIKHNETSLNFFKKAIKKC